MYKSLGLAAGALGLAICMLGNGTSAFAQANVQVGTLTCNVAGGWGFVFGSSKAVRCTFARGGGRPEHYTGSINKFGVDIGYTQGGVLVWGVFAPSGGLAPGALWAIMSVRAEAPRSGSAPAPMCWSAGPTARFRCNRSASKATPVSTSQPGSHR